MPAIWIYDEDYEYLKKQRQPSSGKLREYESMAAVVKRILEREK
jgi:hypothetical protein